MRTPALGKAVAAVIALSLYSSPVALSATKETEHFSIQGDIPAGTIEKIYTIFEERIFTPRSTPEKIPVRIDRRLRSSGFEGKAYADHISLASFSDRIFIHELAHYLWEIRGWTLRPWLADEKARLRRSHPLIKEEFLNHYLVYEHIVPGVEELLGSTLLDPGEGGQADDMAEGWKLPPDG